METSRIVSKHAKNAIGQAPAIILWNPKYPHNVGAALRAASCYGFKQVMYTGDRVNAILEERKRLPREERMKGYSDVQLICTDYPFDTFGEVAEQGKITPVAVEISAKAELLPQFEHPENAVYVFGPEDGSLPSVALRHCHRHVVIPTAHCLNLATAVATVLYDRRAKRQMAGLEPMLAAGQILNEQRGFICDLESEQNS
jgi:tRNA(Leu) C34 or U34 (ribose-2'-O)-methylase TrmL